MRRLSFHTRLVLIIAGVFVAVGAGLLTVQYLVVQHLFDAAISETLESCTAVPGETPDVTEVSATGCVSVDEIDLSGSGTVPLDSSDVDVVGGAVLRQSSFLAAEVGDGLLLWSIVVLVAFTGVAAALAFWLARRSLGRIGEVTATARDISERDLGRRLALPGPNDEIKELGDTIDGMLDRLQSAFVAQDRFVANASHELRTPLTTTRTALEIPLSQGAVPAELEPDLRRALRATEQSERLIAALLTLARAQQGLERVETVDISQVVADQLGDLTAGSVVVHVRAQPLQVSGDGVLIGRALRNLFDNGIRHNSAGGDLWVRSRLEGADAVIEVENTGAVIAPETVALLTEPFYRGDATRTSAGPSGTGLGLALVQSIAESYGGSLQLRARTGGGLVAVLRLPA